MVTIEEANTLEENQVTSVKGNLTLDSDSIEHVTMTDGFLILIAVLNGNIRTHIWPAPNICGFIAQLVRASH